MIADSLPYGRQTHCWKIIPGTIFKTDLLRCLAALLPPTLAMGRKFPLRLRRNSGPPARTQENSWEISYAANTLGSIAGALGVSLILIPTIGTQQSQRVLLVLSAAGGLALLVPYVWKHRSRAVATVLAASSIVAVAGLTSRVHAIPGALIAYGRRMTLNSPSSRVALHGRGYELIGRHHTMGRRLHRG